MTSDGTFNYQHDADGNTTVRTRIASSYATDYQTVYTWDYRNRLTDVEYYDNNSVLTKHVHYVYDVFDHLIATEVDPNGGGQYTSIQHYVLDVSPEIPAAGEPGTALAQPVLVFDGGGNLIGRNLVAPDPAGVDAVMVQGTVGSLTQGDTDIFVAYDNIGTPRDDVDGSGTVVNHRAFSVFGQDVYDSNASVVNWAGFAGGHADRNTGLVNDYHRWYDPATGRWLSADPAGFAAGDPNLERYVGNRPTILLDRSGLGPGPDPYRTYIAPDPRMIVHSRSYLPPNPNQSVDYLQSLGAANIQAQRQLVANQHAIFVAQQWTNWGTVARPIQIIFDIPDANVFRARMEATIRQFELQNGRIELELKVIMSRQMQIQAEMERELGIELGGGW